VRESPDDLVAFTRAVQGQVTNRMALELAVEIERLQAALGTCEYALITGNDVDREDALAAIKEARR